MGGQTNTDKLSCIPLTTCIYRYFTMQQASSVTLSACLSAPDNIQQDVYTQTPTITRISGHYQQSAVMESQPISPHTPIKLQNGGVWKVAVRAQEKDQRFVRGSLWRVYRPRCNTLFETAVFSETWNYNWFLSSFFVVVVKRILCSLQIKLKAGKTIWYQDRELSCGTQRRARWEIHQMWIAGRKVESEGNYCFLPLFNLSL